MSERDPAEQLLRDIFEAVDACDEPCDHCRPDILHPCVLPDGHRGFHSCDPS